MAPRSKTSKVTKIARAAPIARATEARPPSLLVLDDDVLYEIMKWMRLFIGEAAPDTEYRWEKIVAAEARPPWLLNLAATCTRLRSLVMPLLFGRIAVRDTRFINLHVSKLLRVVLQNSRLAECVRELVFTPGSSHSIERPEHVYFDDYENLRLFFCAVKNLHTLEVIIPRFHISKFKAIFKDVNAVVFSRVTTLTTCEYGIELNKNCPAVTHHTISSGGWVELKNTKLVADVKKWLAQLAKARQLRSLTFDHEYGFRVLPPILRAILICLPQLKHLDFGPTAIHVSMKEMLEFFAKMPELKSITLPHIARIGLSANHNKDKKVSVNSRIGRTTLINASWSKKKRCAGMTAEMMFHACPSLEEIRFATWSGGSYDVFEVERDRYDGSIAVMWSGEEQDEEDIKDQYEESYAEEDEEDDEEDEEDENQSEEEFDVWTALGLRNDWTNWKEQKPWEYREFLELMGA